MDDFERHSAAQQNLDAQNDKIIEWLKSKGDSPMRSKIKPQLLTYR